MAENDEITLDIDALDAAKAKKEADKGKTADSDPTVIVDADLASKNDDKTVLTPEAGLDKLKQQLADEKTARIGAEQRARESANAEAAARGDVQKSHLDLIKGAIDQTTQQLDVLENQYAEAMAAQDFKAAAKAQREMSAKSARLSQLEAGENALKNAPKPTPRAPVDPVEAIASKLSAQSAAWVRAHPEFARDQHKYDQMVAAHQLSIARGNKADTPEYFKSIEKTLDLNSSAPTIVAPHADDPEPMADAATAATGGRSAAPAAAPVSRSGNGAAGRPGIVKLGPQQREMAKNMFPDSKDPDLEYAKNMTSEERKRGPM
jgi:hypothetical protein